MLLTYVYFDKFCQEVVGGMLDLEPTLWRKPIQERFDSQRKKVLKFAEMWKPYDWTQRLKQSDNTEEDVVDDVAADSQKETNDDTHSLNVKDEKSPT